MSYKWTSPSALKAMQDAHATEVAELKKKADASAEAPGKLEKIAALFGDASKDADFDLEAVVGSAIEANTQLSTDMATRDATIANLETAASTAATTHTATTKKLETATGSLNAIAVMLGHENAEGVNLVDEIGQLEPEGRNTPLGKKKDKVGEKTTEDTDTMTEADELIAKHKKELAE